MEFRFATDDDIDQLVALTVDTFLRPEERAAVAELLDAAYRHSPRVRADLCAVAVDRGRIVARSQVLELTIRVRGIDLSVAGVQGFAAPPDARGGLPLRMMATLRHRMSDWGFALTYGYASRGRWFSRLLGTEPLHPEYRWSLPVPARGGRPHRFQELDPGDHETPTRLLGAMAGPGSILRQVHDWPLLRWAPQERFHAPGAYIGVRQNEDALEVREAVGSDPGFGVEALDFLCEETRRRGLSRLEGELPPDHPIVLASHALGCDHTTRWSAHSGAIGAAENVGVLLDAMRPVLAGADIGSLEVEGGHRVDVGEGLNVRVPCKASQLLPLIWGGQSAANLDARHGWDLPRDHVDALATAFPTCHPNTWPADRF